MQGIVVAVRSKGPGIVVIREWQNLDARYNLVLSLLHRWSQCTKSKAKDSFLPCVLLCLTLLLSFPFSFINFPCNLSRFCIGQLSVKMRRFPCALFGQ